MKTYNDLIECGENETLRKAFIETAIRDHKASPLYRIASDARMYYQHMNPSIMRAQKMIYDMQGKATPDYYSANNKIPCRYYFYFVTQEVQYLLGNGVSFNDDNTKDKLGEGFDNAIQNAATEAINGGVSFLFWNMNHVETFSVAGGDEPSFVPLYDEENGALRAGIRFWQIDENKPLRATLYEEDGVTEYIKKDEEMEILQDKRNYVQISETSEASGTTIYNGGNYPNFPIVPFYNINRQSELVGSRETLDAYDLMASALINNVDEGNLIYWVLKNLGGMDDMDDVKFVERLKTIHVAHADGDSEGSVEAHTVEAPFQANEVALERLRNQLFDDFMALDTKNIVGGAATATQIRAAYEPLNGKADMFEYRVTEAIKGLLKLVGIEDEPTYTRSMIVNKQEEISNLLQSAEYLSSDYITEKILAINGDIDRLDEVKEQKIVEDMSRYEPEQFAEPEETEETEETEEPEEVIE